jgi:hypothetical protein
VAGARLIKGLSAAFTVRGNKPAGFGGSESRPWT